MPLRRLRMALFGRLAPRPGLAGTTFPLTADPSTLYFSNNKNRERRKALKKVKPFDLAYEQYKLLKEKLNTTRDVQEKNLIFKRLANLLAVMEFLISLNKTQ